ncbi:trophoblast glycoprotein isoform X2 [Halyomorpha halys]|nr:phospholipase A2 inhibitor isoform X2 [Halyomorpha halys]XP_024217113.1 phospholipase A2 inhibitor isoform X2 [Halyomorpha halys]
MAKCPIILLLCLPTITFGLCPDALAKCYCGEAEYLFKKQYIVNCTNTGFNNTIPLQKLPDNVEVLIFTGNNVPELPINLFGNSSNNNLKIIDMSNNKIKIIHGKAYHKVVNVERLILNHNELTTDASHHPRLFSNFQNLLELHLTDAFDDNSPENFASLLHNIFLESDLIKLRKLHLEQNEIRSIKDHMLFCSLQNLMDLHLGDNKLEHIKFKINCLRHLRFIDLERNSIVYLNKDELSELDVLPHRGQNLTIDLSENPFSCGYQIEEFFSWLNTTLVNVRNKNKLKCKHDPKNSDEPLFLNLGQSCHLKQSVTTNTQESSSTVTFLSLIIVAITLLLIYTNREVIKNKLLPVVLSLSQKVHYTTIGKNEAHEMDV